MKVPQISFEAVIQLADLAGPLSSDGQDDEDLQRKRVLKSETLLGSMTFPELGSSSWSSA